ncbi:hypothetical protein [Candidatus Deianiraea vastatrix]|uniref:Transmembrane protein n=1 Tax=Candidatus Deianiraea vastatrix TaxID=2163644 RepID=A0A5B8XHE8_9RICK|nr:hypothetical protein [Candidatus Deianiraea vastatrix]QED23574.1 hypothetical protein Deia_00786 [Candidatus Deianiraea vastatrix]
MNERLKKALKWAGIGFIVGACGGAISLGIECLIIGKEILTADVIVGTMFSLSGVTAVMTPLCYEIIECIMNRQEENRRRRIFEAIAQLQDNNQENVPTRMDNDVDIDAIRNITGLLRIGNNQQQIIPQGDIPANNDLGHVQEEQIQLNLGNLNNQQQQIVVDEMDQGVNQLQQSIDLQVNISQHNELNQVQEEQIIPQINAQIQQQEQSENNNIVQINQNGGGIHIQGEIQRRNSGSNLQQG